MAHNCCNKALSIYVFATRILLIILYISDTYSTAFIQHDNVVIDCTSEDATEWHRWYNRYNSTTYFPDPSVINGTKCRIQCSLNCTCSLGKMDHITVTAVNCSNISISLAEGFVLPDVKYLSLGESTLQEIEKDAFAGWAGLVEILNLNAIGLQSLQPGAFNGLRHLLHLDLRNNLLVEVHHGVFQGLSRLEKLHLGDNMLQCLHPHVFQGLAELWLLDLRDNMLSELYPDAFQGLAKLERLYLFDNLLIDLPSDVFRGLPKLRMLRLNDNKLHTIDPPLLLELPELQFLKLSGNMLNELHAGVFQGLACLRVLHLTNGLLTKLYPGVFEGLAHLSGLDLSNNILNELDPDVFQGLTKLRVLLLGNNSLSEVHPNTFGGISALIGLDLSYNQLTSLHPDTFKNQSKLQWLILSNNRLVSLPDGIFQSLLRLNQLDLSANELHKLNSGLFSNCIVLETLGLTNNALLWVTKDVFEGLNGSTSIHVDQYATCCFVTSASCNYYSPKSVYLTCERLLPYGFLRIGTWVVSLAAVFGNIIVLGTRFRQKQGNKVQIILITNLSIADLIMGIYLTVILSADLYFEDYFPSHSELWRNSSLCRLIGALSVLSSQASVFFITLISIDRFLGIKYPFSGHHLGTKSARIVVSLLWLVTFGIGLASFALSGSDTGIYEVSEICVGLPISRKAMYETNVSSVFLDSSAYTGERGTVTEYILKGSKVGMYFSIAIFICLNLTCFMIVGCCYLTIFITIRKAAKKSARSRNANEEIRMAKKMSLIVLTDFCCWVPLGILSILVQSGAVSITPVAYAWIATFVLPINSAINPFLYTLATKISDRQTGKSAYDSATGSRTSRLKNKDSNIQMSSISR